jgi:hypothetical protein
LALDRAGFGFDQIQVEIEMAIRIVTALADEGDVATIGRPRGELLIMCARGQRLTLTARDLDAVQVASPLAEIVAAIFLELVTVR